MPQDQNVISATLTLANGCLRASLQVEVSLSHPSFSAKSPLCDLRKNAEENLPIALAEVAPPALRQILETAEARLLAGYQENLSTFFSSIGEQIGKSNPDPEPAGDAQSHTTLADCELVAWLADQNKPFSISEAASGLDFPIEKQTRDLQTRIGIALRKLGCTKVELRDAPGNGRFFYRPPNHKADERKGN